MIELSPKVNLCLHVVPEFKDGEHVVCRLETDQGPLDMATCKPCLDRVLNGDTTIYEKYVSVTRDRAAVLGVKIQGSPTATNHSTNSADEYGRWGRLVLSDTVLSKLKALCESLRSADSLRKQGLTPPRGAILYGEPGTGKTQIARTLSVESGLAFIAPGPGDLRGGYIGQSGQRVREVFEAARAKSPCIVFIDEFDSVAPARDGSYDNGFSRDVVNNLLAQIDGIEKKDGYVFLLGATLYRERIDAAVLARLTYQIEIPIPELEQRQQLYNLFIGQHHLPVDFEIDAMTNELARRSVKMSGRSISTLVLRAVEAAKQRAWSHNQPDRVTLTQQDLLAEIIRSEHR